MVLLLFKTRCCHLQNKLFMLNSSFQVTIIAAIFTMCLVRLIGYFSLQLVIPTTICKSN